MGRTSCDLSDTFITDILSESKTAAGTWSLATLNRLTLFISKASPDAIDFFGYEVIRSLIDAPTGSIERFKLAQLCATLRRACPRINSVFQEYRADLLEIAAHLENPLDPSISKLLNGLFEPVNSNRTIPRPSAVTVCRSKVMVTKRPAMSMTPQPA
jgi:hypothetical protein